MFTYCIEHIGTYLLNVLSKLGGEMRELLFRGKSAVNKEWVHGYYYKDKNYTYILKKGWSFSGEPVLPDTIGQYTGFDDIKRNKIFEDDIVRVHYNDHPYSDEDDICVVEYQLEKYEYPAFDLYPHDCDCNYFSHIYATGNYTVVIMGNKFDNDELYRRRVL